METIGEEEGEDLRTSTNLRVRVESKDSRRSESLNLMMRTDSKQVIEELVVEETEFDMTEDQS
jgi:hypothetical protein